MSNEVSLLDTDVRNKIRTKYLDGKNFKEIQLEMGISAGNWDSQYYLDRQGFRSFVLDIKRQYMLQEAERVSGEILSLKAENNAKLLSIMQKEAEFLRETQGKDLGYSKRIETIGFNVNKNEPLDDEQKARLDKLIKVSGNKVIKNVDYTIVSEDSQGTESPLDNNTTQNADSQADIDK